MQDGVVWSQIGEGAAGLCLARSERCVGVLGTPRRRCGGGSLSSLFPSRVPGRLELWESPGFDSPSLDTECAGETKKDWPPQPLIVLTLCL